MQKGKYRVHIRSFKKSTSGWLQVKYRAGLLENISSIKLTEVLICYGFKKNKLLRPAK